jgi:urease accessory protein
MRGGGSDAAVTPAPVAAVAAGTKGRGVAEIDFARRAGRSRLTHLYQRDPLRVLFPHAADDDAPLAVLVTTSGGLAGGDTLAVDVSVGEGASLHVTAQAAEKIYRTDGPDTEVSLRLAAADGAWLEYLPPETILFDGARLRRHATVDLGRDAAFLGGEIAVFGRIARGETLTAGGLLHDAWEIRREGRAVWADALHLDGDLPALLADPACLDGATAAATLILAAPGVERFLDGVRKIIAARAVGGGVRGGATLVNGVLLARLLGRDAAVLRGAYAGLAESLRRAAGGFPPRLPRTWHI